MSSDYEKYIQQQAKERDEFFKKYPEEYEKQQLQRQQRFMELKAKRELANQRLKKKKRKTLDKANQAIRKKRREIILKAKRELAKQKLNSKRRKAHDKANQALRKKRRDEIMKASESLDTASKRVLVVRQQMLENRFKLRNLEKEKKALCKAMKAHQIRLETVAELYPVTNNNNNDNSSSQASENDNNDKRNYNKRAYLNKITKRHIYEVKKIQKNQTMIEKEHRVLHSRKFYQEIGLRFGQKSGVPCWECM